MVQLAAEAKEAADSLSQTTELTYDLQTDPAIIVTSPPMYDPLLATLIFTISNPTKNPILVDSIEISIPVGEAGTDLTPSTASIQYQVTDTVDWEIEAPPPTTSGTASYILNSASGQGNPVTFPASGSITVLLYQIATNNATGTSLITITETIHGEPATTTQFTLTTFPYSFFFNNLTISTPQISKMGTVTLNWQSSVKELNAFTIWYSDRSTAQPQSVVPTTLGTWTSPPLTSDTTFIVKVQTTSAGGQPISEALSTSVVVTNSDFGTMSAQTITTVGDVTVGGIMSAQTIKSASDFTIGGNLAAQSVTTTRDATIGGVMSAQGIKTASDVIVGGGMSVNSVYVNGPISCQNYMNVVGTVASAIPKGINQSSGAFVNYPPDGGAVCAHFGTLSANAGWFGNWSDTYSSVFIQNPSNVQANNNVLGLYVKVAGAEINGIYTNGRMGSGSGSSLFTHLPTRNGHRVVTSPLSLESEVHLSGSATLTKGKAIVTLSQEAQDIIFHTDQHPYRIQVTPLGQCCGLAVTAKSKDHFVVEELLNGESNVGFDWFIIARKPHELNSTRFFEMPEKLPEAHSSKIPET